MFGELTAAPASTEVDVTAVLDGLHVHLQPIVDLATGTPVAVEALARFRHAPGRPVEEIFSSAHEAGFGYLLEAACLRAALARRDELPAGVRMAVNVSPDVLLHPVVSRGWNHDLDGVIIEVTEHRASRPTALQDELARLRGRGATIAVDDVGTGYAGLLRLATMRPDFVKLDRSVVSGVRSSEAQAAVLDALVRFSHRMGGAVIGEGIEALADIEALVEFDIDYGQGWAIAAPQSHFVPMDADVVDACQRARGNLLQHGVARASAAVSTDAMYAVASALGNAVSIAQLHAATAEAAVQLGVDLIGVSVVDSGGELREITSSGAAIDTRPYALIDFPATQQVLKTGNAVEVHVDDPRADTAETALLRSQGQASLLMLPLRVGAQPIGVLEFHQCRHRRWTGDDIANGHGLAVHIAHALARITA